MTNPRGPQATEIALPKPLPGLPEIRPNLQTQVYTHAGAETNASPQSNKRLSVLGSKCLGASVAAILFDVCDGHLSPKQMTELHNKYVSASTLGNWAREYGFHLQVHVVGNVHLDKKSTVPGDAFQAYLGAIMLTSSHEHLTDFLRNLLEPELSQIEVEQDGRGDMIVQDLHDRLLKLDIQMPNYQKKEDETAEENERYEIKCRLAGEIIGRGVGRSYKIAKCLAAKAAMRKTERQLTMLKGKMGSRSED